MSRDGLKSLKLAGFLRHRKAREDRPPIAAVVNWATSVRPAWQRPGGKIMFVDKKNNNEAER